MTSWQHRDWIDRGRPDSGLARPLAQLLAVLQSAGYTVYEYPNDAHLDAEPPEDHTYYAETGWPIKSPKWWRHAIDIMPPTKPGLPSLTVLGQRIFNARQAGQITWLKYMNWPSTGDLSRAVKDTWQTGYSRRASSDTGHIHLSSITGVETRDAPYNPLLAATPEADMPLTQDDIINVASAVVQWSTEGGALPPQFRGAGTNLLSLEAQLRGLTKDLGTLASKVDALSDALAVIAAHVGTGGSPATGDVTVSGTLHLGGNS
jgi:hypothetical protein